ncbi:TPA: AraC family transcriptional regulator ligand-binding domain-containing protein, partial [Acinetobacter baumannii]
MGQLTDASVVLRFGYQAIRRAGLPTEEILTKAGVALNQVDTNARTPLSAQYAFWTAAQEVSKDPDIGLHLGEHLPLYRGQVIEHLFISS